MYQGYTTTSTINVNNGSPAVSVTLNYNTVNGYAISNIPVIQPYGFCSLAPDNAWCIYDSLGNGYYGSYVSGYTNLQNADSNLTSLVSGESATFNSTGFTRQLKLDGAFDVFTGAIDQITTAAINGENTNQILVDLCSEIKALETYINSFITAYNIHVHSGVTTGVGTSAVPTVTRTAYTPSSNFTRDDTFLNQSPTPNLINDDGEVLA